jgi:hypothetical protein
MERVKEARVEHDQSWRLCRRVKVAEDSAVPASDTLMLMLAAFCICAWKVTLTCSSSLSSSPDGNSECLR